MKGAFYWRVRLDGVPDQVTVLVLETLDGLRRIMHPGRRSTPLEIRHFNRSVVASSLVAILETNPSLLAGAPGLLVGSPIYTEGAGVPYLDAFDDVWPGKRCGGQAAMWVRRKKEGECDPSLGYAPFSAEVLAMDRQALDALARPGIFMTHDIGATGATTEVWADTALRTGRVDRIIFGSPCTSAVAIQKFVKVALKYLPPEAIGVVASAGIFALGKNGTYLSLLRREAICSSGALRVARKCYPDDEFCEVGAGGFAANCQGLYENELEDDERNFQVFLPKFSSIEEVMEHAGVRWPEDFGMPSMAAPQRKEAEIVG